MQRAMTGKVMTKMVTASMDLIEMEYIKQQEIIMAKMAITDLETIETDIIE